MEFFAVARSGVQIFTFQPGEEVPSEPSYQFPAVSTADGCSWSGDGAFLGLADSSTGGVVVLNAAAGYALLCQVAPISGGPVRSFYFSPLGNHLVTYERYAKDAGHNVGLWDTRTGSLRTSFTLKQVTEMSWPPLKWTEKETHCCRMVQDGVLIFPGTMDKEEGTAVKLSAPGIMAFEVAPRSPGPAGTGSPHVAICIAESKGAPAKCQIFRLEDPTRPTANKNFFKAQTVTMMWNNVGSSVLVKTSMEVDDTGKSYYGGSNLYFLSADGQESSVVAAAEGGTIHDVAWSPIQDEFLLLHGQLPCTMALHDGKKGQKRMDFGQGHRNTIRWNQFGRFFVMGGHGQLVGDTDFWDKPGKKLLGSVRMECCVVCGWAPDGRHFLGATTAPRMRVDNKIVVYDYCGSQLASLPFEELLLAGWRPRPRGAFQDRPPSPGRKAGDPKAQPASPKKQAYRPPGARGGGGLAELLRKELGSTAAESSTTAVKVTGAAPAAAAPRQALPPGASPDLLKQQESASAANARNERKKKAKEAAKAAAEAAEQERQVAALSAPSAAAGYPKAKAVAKAPAPVAAPAAEEGGDADETEKKVRALRKKLREIEKLKEKDGPLDPLQKQKIDGEAELLRQLRDLGAEP